MSDYCEMYRWVHENLCECGDDLRACCECQADANADLGDMYVKMEIEEGMLS